MNLEGKHVLVVGLARSGMAAVRLLRKLGAQVTVSESKPREQIRELALELGPDIVALSKLFDAPDVQALPGEEVKQAESSDLRLDEIIPKLIASYKLGIVRHELQGIIEQMKNPATKADKERYRKLMTEFSQKSLLVKELAKQCGERVVLK